MSDYSSVAPPQSSSSQQQNFSQSSAFAAALQRAKQIAAKIHPGGQAQQQGTKRSLDDGPEPESKKFSGSEYSSSNSSMSPAAMAVQQAAAVAARISQSVGASINEDVRLPEKIAALLAGRSGPDDALGRLQSESGAKLQLARDSDRVLQLSGSRDAVAHAKDLLDGLCQQHGCHGGIETVSCVVVPPAGNGGFAPYQEIMVPGSKVGLVIGKGGETIKSLQEKTGAKMVIIQDGPEQEASEKPLRISGDPQKVELAKQLVFELIAEKDNFMNGGGGGGMGGRGGHGGGNEQLQLFVPKTAVGVVIGKGGEMIKKIQVESGCKLQFVQGKDDAMGDRRCIITGTKQQVEEAKLTIEELIESVMRGNHNQGGGMGGGGGHRMSNSNYGYGSDANAGGPLREEVMVSVPAAKCGIVIGRGGETIKLINQQSGAYCEMDRSALNPPNEKIFKVKGTADQIEHARQLISEKVGCDVAVVNSREMGGGGGGSYGGGGMQGNGQYGGGGGQQWGGGGGYQQQQQWDQQAAAAAQQQQQGVQINPATGQADYSAQWIEYYKSIGLSREAEMIEQQMKSKMAGGAGTANGGATAQQQQMQAAAAAAAAQQQQSQAGGQPTDYSKQWAEYYRSIGRIDEAEAIEKTIKSSTSSGGAGTGASGNSTGSPANGSGYGQQYAGAGGYGGSSAYGSYAGGQSGNNGSGSNGGNDSN